MRDKQAADYVESVAVDELVAGQRRTLLALSILPRGTQIAARVTLKRPCFAYLVRIAADDTTELLSPPATAVEQRLAPHAEHRLPPGEAWLRLVDDARDLCLVLATAPLHPTSWDFCAAEGRQGDTQANNTKNRDPVIAETEPQQAQVEPPLFVLVVED